MAKEKSYFGIGLVVGIIFTFLFLYYFAPRYTTVKSGDTLIKQDRWSGDSWRMVDNQWKEISEVTRETEKIDKALMDALRVTSGGPKRSSALSLLKSKHPVLKDVPDDELLERMKVVYSKQILCSLYLNNFMNLEKGSEQNTSLSTGEK